MSIGYNMRNGYGIAHGDELLQMFRMQAMPYPMDIGPISERDKMASSNILQAWTNFAKSGTPDLNDKIAFSWNPSLSPKYE